MNKRLPIVLSLLVLSSFCFAQKSSKETLTIQYTIDPTIPAPEKAVTYSSLIQTPLDPLTKDETEAAGSKLPEAKKAKLEALAKTNLAISGSKYSNVAGIGDWLVKLETGDVKVTSTSDKPLNELGWEDAVFGYTCPANLKVTDKSGNVILEKIIAGPDEEQKMPKYALFSNPANAVKLSMVKNNPEKLKKLTDQLLEKKNNLVLMFLLEKSDNALADAFELQDRTEYVSIFSVKGKAYSELGDVSEKIFDTYGKFHALSKKNRVPKEDMDKVMLESVAVWEKYIAGNPELEEQAKKGLILNCALATTWAGDYEKAADYLAQVPEAKADKSPQEEDAPSSASPGATVILSFTQSAVNLRNLHESFGEYKSRAKVSQ